MKIVDQTPFYKENSELSLIDRGKAIMQFGFGWFKEIEAQKMVIAVLKKTLDKNYTLLCNIIPPGLDARIPLILVGPTGVYVMSATTKTGIFRARGDQWGTISGNTLRPENPNLLSLTEKMARAIQVYLQRKGVVDLINVEAVLLCTDLAMTVDSMRPIIRVIMRDTFERFAVSITQARIVLTPESAFDIVNRLLNPPPPPPAKPVDTAGSVTSATFPDEPADPYAPTFALPGSVADSADIAPALSPIPAPGSETTPAAAPSLRPRPGLTRSQILLLAGMLVIWILIVIGLAIYIMITMNPPLILLK